MVRRVNAKQRARWARIFAFFKKLAKKPDKFYFGTWHRDQSGNKELPNLAKCDTSACFAGWLPTIFPRDWKYYGYHNDVPSALKLFDVNDETDNFECQLGAFLGITPDQVVTITTPGVVMSSLISPQEWVKRTRAFLKDSEIKVI